MSTAVSVINVPVEESEAYQVLIARLGRRGGKIPAEPLGPPCARLRAAPGVADTGRGLEAVVRRLESARKDALRVEGRPARGGCWGSTSPGGRVWALGPIARSLTGVDPIVGPVRLSRFPQELAGPLQAPAGGARAPPHPAAALATGDQGAGVERPADSGIGLSWDPIRPLTGVGDWLDRVVWKGDLNGRDRGRRRSRRRSRGSAPRRTAPRR